MSRNAPFLGRVALTLLLLVGAVGAGRMLWARYMEDPWTRDGRVRAQIVTVAPDVPGLVSEVLVRDNQHVKPGDVLFRIDRERFALALDQADAAVAKSQAALAESTREALRYGKLDDVSVSQKTKEQAVAAAQVDAAAYRQAVADRAIAALNLKRTEVVSLVDGVVSNLALEPGDYVTAGKGVMALLDTATLHIEGYFEETKLSRIHLGAPVTVRLMGQAQVLHGHVESIAAGIEDRERADSTNLLANVNPTFNWVRLAQRVPVRVKLDEVPADVALVAGRTATVAVEPATSG